MHFSIPKLNVDLTHLVCYLRYNIFAHEGIKHYPSPAISVITYPNTHRYNSFPTSLNDKYANTGVLKIDIMS